MVVCCSCNRTGQCRGCACVKAGKQCTNCLPGRLGKFSNAPTANPTVSGPSSSAGQTAAIPPVAPSSQMPTSPSTSSDPPTSIVTDTPDHDSLLPTHVVIAIPNTQDQDSSMLPTPVVAAVPDIPASSSASHATTTHQVQSNPDKGSAGDLPSFSPIAKPSFLWGRYLAEVLMQSLDEAYEEVVHWRPNFFCPPLGKAGKSFASELTRL